MNKKGQNALEYMLMLAAMILVVLAALAPNGFFTVAVEDSLAGGITAIETMAASANFE